MLKWPATFLLTAAMLSAPALAVPTTSVDVFGQVGTPTVYTGATLGALPQTTETVSYTSGGIAVTNTFTGPTLWGLLQGSGGITVNPAIKNDILRKYVIETGSDGYKAVISAGEISPKFGNKADLVAIGDTAGRLPGADGLARVVAAGDKAGGRYVANLASLEVGSGPVQLGTGGGPSTQFVIQGAVGTVMTFDLPALQSLTPYTQTVTYTSGTATLTDTYTGALLWDVLGRAGITTNPANKNDILRKLVTATGSDGYQVDFAAGELSPTFGNAPILVAYSDTNGDIAAGSGFARLVVPGDLAGGRYVSNLTSLTVSDPTLVPEPASAALLAAGLAGAIALRRRRQIVAATLLAGVLAMSAARAEEPVRIYAAGSLGAVLPAMIAASGLPSGTVAPPVFGPAGVLGQRLVSGEAADLFASADLAQPQKVAAARGALIVPFARNRMCVVSPERLGLTSDNLLDRMLSPGLRLAASTPGADPGGDYARAVFAKAETLRPGAEAALRAKTLLLLGGPGSMTPQPGHTPAGTIFLGDHGDALLYYCSGTAATLKEVPGLVSLPLPDTLEVHPVYGLAVLTDRPEAARLALFMLSEKGQAMLSAAGLLPLVGAP